MGPIDDQRMETLLGLLVRIGDLPPSEKTRPQASNAQKKAELPKKRVQDAKVGVGNKAGAVETQLEANTKNKKPEKAEEETTLQSEQVKKDSQKVSSAQAGYWMALSTLSFEANKPTRHAFWILMLGGISGVLGVQLRSLVNFIGRACFKNSVSLTRWWPWYVIRPMAGFLLGVLAVVLIESNLVSTNGQEASVTTGGWASP